jgi:hypothetical protein
MRKYDLTIQHLPRSINRVHRIYIMTGTCYILRTVKHNSVRHNNAGRITQYMHYTLESKTLYLMYG